MIASIYAVSAFRARFRLFVCDPPGRFHWHSGSQRGPAGDWRFTRARAPADGVVPLPLPFPVHAGRPTTPRRGSRDRMPMRSAARPQDLSGAHDSRHEDTNPDVAHAVFFSRTGNRQPPRVAACFAFGAPRGLASAAFPRSRRSFTPARLHGLALLFSRPKRNSTTRPPSR
jgi:hypothetical protein